MCFFKVLLSTKVSRISFESPMAKTTKQTFLNFIPRFNSMIVMAAEIPTCNSMPKGMNPNMR